MKSIGGNPKLTALQKMKLGKHGVMYGQESETDRELRMLKLQKAKKQDIIEYFSIHIFKRSKSWDNPRIMEDDIAKALGDQNWAAKVAGIK